MKAIVGSVMVLACFVASWTPVGAQSSTSYELSEHVLNSGGVPDGAVVGSASYSVSLASIGEGLAGGPSPTSASFRVDSGFSSAYPAPTEVSDLVFLDSQTLDWDAERSAGTYNLYRDTLDSLSGLGYGDCTQQDVASSTTTDATVPASGSGFFYLVTAENRLREEGTKGSDSDDLERTGTACP